MIAASCAIDWIAVGQTFCTDSRLVKSVLARINCTACFSSSTGPLIDTKGAALRFLISSETSGGSAAYLLLCSPGRTFQNSNISKKFQVLQL